MNRQLKITITIVSILFCLGVAFFIHAAISENADVSAGRSSHTSIHVHQ